jgi:cholesterol oxidase
MKDQYDVVVIGSGFGGGITACRLAQSGRSVCVLERGRRWRNTDFPRSPAEVDRNAFWDVDSGRYGLMEYRVFRGMHVIQGCGVGGGSLHYFNVHLRAPAVIFDDPRWPVGVSADVLAPYHDLAADMLDVRPLNPPAHRSLPARTTMFQQACRAAGHAPELVDLAVYTGPGRTNLDDQITQQACDYSGNCALGCATQAKNSVDVTYLSLAERHGAEIHPLHEVDLIEQAPDGGYRVLFDQLEPDRPGTRTAGSVLADTVIVAAGTLGTNELLLRCRDQRASLPLLSSALGQGFSGNGDMLLAGALTDREVNQSRGPSITAGVDFSSAHQQIFIEDLGFPDLLTWFLEGMLANAALPLNLLRWAKLFIRGSLGISGATARLSHERQMLFGGGRTRGYLPFLGMCQDAGDGRFTLDRTGELDLRWNPRASLRNLAEMEDAMRVISRAVGGVYLPSPLWASPLRELLTAHPLGGCAMADNPDHGVVNEYGEVHGYPRLYVADGSIVPTPLSRNPSATISALAERVAFHLIHRRDLRAGDTATPPNTWQLAGPVPADG